MHWRANNMKHLILVLLVSIIVFSQCDNLPVIGNKKPSEKIKETILRSCWFGSLVTPPRTESRVIDNRDGTISLADVRIAGTDICIIPGIGKRETFTIKYYIKKCIQGQVYRSAQNDCKGTGTATNYYGAQKYQVCAVDGGCNETTSPAYLACSSDKSLNRTFRLNNITNFVNANLIYSYFSNRPDEIPNDFFWFSGIEKLNFFTRELSTTTQQTENNYVLCS